MNFKEIISSKTKLFETTKICLANNKAEYLIDNLRSVYRSSRILNKNEFFNLIALDSELKKTKWYFKIVEHSDYDNYRKIKLRNKKIELERKIEKRREKIQEKQIMLERKNKINERRLTKWFNINSDNKVSKIKEKGSFFHKKNKDFTKLVSYIFLDKEMPAFEWFSKTKIDELFKRLEFNKKMSNEQYLRYKTVQSLFSDLPIKSRNEINKLVEAKNKILTKDFLQWTYIVYNRNWK